MQRKINFNNIIDGLVATNGCSRNTAESFLRELFLLVTELIQQNKTISIKGIGSFLKDTNDEGSIIYEPDKSLLEVLNQPFSYFEPIELDDLLDENMLNDEYLTNQENDENESVEDVSKQESKSEKLNESMLTHNESFEMNQSEIIDSEELPIKYISENNEDVENDSIKQSNSQINNQLVNLDSEENKSTVSKTIIYWGIFIIGLIVGFSVGYIVKDILISNKLVEYFQPKTHIDSDSKLVQPFVIDDSIIETKEISNDSNKQIQVVEGKINTDTVITDQITKNRFLTTMAREYYGNLIFWVYIYEENASKLGHPDKISPGTIVVIPPVSKYMIDALNEDAINIAKSKSKEIYAKFQKKD